MQRLRLGVPVSLAALLVFTMTAQASGTRAADTLNLQGEFRLTGTPSACPSGTPSTTSCVQVTGTATIRGLGVASETYAGMLDRSNPSCQHASWTPVVVNVAGKGKLDVSFTDPYTCDPTSGAAVADFTISGGTGPYQDATGTGTVTNAGSPPNVTDTWSGTLDAPDTTFDLTPPTIHAPNDIMRFVRNGTHSRRVNYQVTATDAADGTVPVNCKPRSGSQFKLGRTHVTCTASDTSANTTRTTFTIRVARRH